MYSSTQSAPCTNAPESGKENLPKLLKKINGWQSNSDHQFYIWCQELISWHFLTSTGVLLTKVVTRTPVDDNWKNLERHLLQLFQLTSREKSTYIYCQKGPSTVQKICRDDPTLHMVVIFGVFLVNFVCFWNENSSFGSQLLGQWRNNGIWSYLQKRLILRSVMNWM